MPSINSISVEKLSKLIGLPHCPMLLDVRREEAFVADPRLIPGSIRHGFTPNLNLSALLPAAAQAAIVICDEGRKISEGVAARLRANGIGAETLEGGFRAWARASLPAIPAAKLPPRDANGRTTWVTRSRPKIDRIACPWLIRRFIDPQAVFLFVAAAEVKAVAEVFAATPFDIEDVFYSHRGERCSFDTFLDEFQLRLPALLGLAEIVRAADTATLDRSPESAGLLAASLGLSRMYADDLKQLEAGMLLYDAFYRWCRDATDETHNWPTNKQKIV
jgi:rhodanese-related sulfurtransferase